MSPVICDFLIFLFFLDPDSLTWDEWASFSGCLSQTEIYRTWFCGIYEQKVSLYACSCHYNNTAFFILFFLSGCHERVFSSDCKICAQIQHIAAAYCHKELRSKGFPTQEVTSANNITEMSIWMGLKWTDHPWVWGETRYFKLEFSRVGREKKKILTLLFHREIKATYKG